MKESNITVGGDQTLEAWLAEEEAKKSGKEKNLVDKEKIKADRKAIYSSPRVRYDDPTEKSGPVKQWPQAIINKINMKETIKMAIDKKQSIAQMIITTLSSGSRHTCESIARALTELGKPTTAKQISNPLYMIYKSGLGHLLERSGSGQGGAGFVYMMNRFGQALTPEQLYSIYSKAHLLNCWSIMDEVPKLKEMGYTPPEGGPPVHHKSKRKVKPAPKLPDTPEIKEAINAGINLLEKEKENPQEHDININVNVRFSFSFNMD